jgi:beta-glucosidase
MKILTLNTWQECGPWLKRWEVIFEGLERHNPDLVGFQEVFNPDWAKTVVKRAGFPYMVFPRDPSGLMVLSRFPILEWDSYTMTAKSQTENYLRYALFVSLQIAKNRLAVFNTHLSWKLDDGRIRESQVAELLAFIQRKTAGLETIVVGDFNAPPGTPEIKKMTAEAGFVDTFDWLYPGHAGITWDNVNPFAGGSRHPLPDRRIDYIFIRDASHVLKDLESVQVIFDNPNSEGVFASDHFGLLATFREVTKI